MHQERRVETIDLVQILLSVTTVVGDRSVNAVAHGRQEGHQRPEAVTKYGNLAGALGHLGHGIGGVLVFPYTGLSVIGVLKAKTARPSSPPMQRLIPALPSSS